MTNPMINPQPNYSGVTIQITNPSVNCPPPCNPQCNNYYNQCTNPQINGGNIQNQSPYISNPAYANPAYVDYGTGMTQPQIAVNPNQQAPVQQQTPIAYPPQYYLNNYNYQNNSGLNGNETNANRADNGAGSPNAENPAENNLNKTPENINNEQITAINSQIPQQPEDMSKSNEIIHNLDSKNAANKTENKNGTQKRVVALTDEYIKSLENYLNNPNDEIRLMASKEVLKRLDEDKERFDDAALNALLNKMLQDPSKLIRIASLSAFASQLACGNDYTVQLLHNIQANPNADKDDVLQAADILLKMSSSTELKYIPVQQVQQKAMSREEELMQPPVNPVYDLQTKAMQIEQGQ